MTAGTAAFRSDNELTRNPVTLQARAAPCWLDGAVRGARRSATSTPPACLGRRPAAPQRSRLTAPTALQPPVQVVQQFAASQPAFFSAFASAYLKMGRMGATFVSYG